MNAIDVLAARYEEIRTCGQFDPQSEAVVASPCISVCRMSADRSHCTGCFRTLDEIRVWSGADGDTRRRIWMQLLARAGISPSP